MDKIKNFTKARLNYLVGKEQEEVFIASLPRLVEKDDDPLLLLLKQVRQNEYRRGYAQALEDNDKSLSNRKPIVKNLTKKVKMKPKMNKLGFAV